VIKRKLLQDAIDHLNEAVDIMEKFKNDAEDRLNYIRSDEGVVKHSDCTTNEYEDMVDNLECNIIEFEEIEKIICDKIKELKKM
jgi:hypothetical protein